MFGRYRNLIVLVGVLFAQILGLAVQVRRAKDKDSEPTRLIRVWAVGTVSPLEKGLSWVQNSTGNLWHNYFYLRGVRAENRDLKHQIEQMRLEQARMTQDAAQAHRLQALLGFKEQFIAQTVAAQVIGGTGSELSRSIYIDKGERDGIKPDMAVVTRDGIVGKVLRVYRSTSLVLLIDDQTSGVGSILEKSRLQGILRGTSSGEVVLEKVMSDETVPEGEQVLTSGGDGVFPKGLTVGTVTRVKPGNDLFLNIRVRPAADLDRLEEVLVVTKVDEKPPDVDQTTPIRAVDILAERLPTVPPKPEVPAPGQPAAQKIVNPNTNAPNTNTPKLSTPNSAALAKSPSATPTAPGATLSQAVPKPRTATLPAATGANQASTGAPKPNSSAPNSVAPSTERVTPNPQAAAIKKIPAASPSSTARSSAVGSSTPGTPTTSSAAKTPAPKPSAS
ncbi:MAG: rod shape-determining protein MreC, partial [Terriglobales bacterium]